MKTAWLHQERSSPFSLLNTAKCYLVVVNRYLRKCQRELSSCLGSRGGALPSRPIVGAFVFPTFWGNSRRVNSNLAHIRDCGVNAIMTESDSLRASYGGCGAQSRTSFLCERRLLLGPCLQLSFSAPTTRAMACPRERKAPTADGMVRRHVADGPQAPGGGARGNQVDCAVRIP